MIISNLGKGKSIIQATGRKQKNGDSKHQFLILMKMNDGQNILLLSPYWAVKSIAFVINFSKRAFERMKYSLFKLNVIIVTNHHMIDVLLQI